MLHDFLHPLPPGEGYNFWSGIAGSFITSTSTFGIFVTVAHKHNCIERGCWRWGHYDKKSGLMKCRKHHPML